MEENKLYIIDSNGEILREVSGEDKLTVTSKHKRKGMEKKIANTKQRKKFSKDNGNFLFRFHGDKQMEVYAEITDSDMARLMYVATYADYEGVLRLDSGAIVDKSILFSIVNVHRAIFNKWYNLMIKCELLYNIDNIIKVNEDFCKKGIVKSNNGDYTRVFINSIRNLYESNIGKDIGTIGAIFKLIPYIHYKYCILTYAPNSQTTTQVMRMKDVMKIMGMDSKQIRRCAFILSQYRICDEPIFKFITDGINNAENIVIINPKLFYRGNMDDYKMAVNFFKDGILEVEGYNKYIE